MFGAGRSLLKLTQRDEGFGTERAQIVIAMWTIESKRTGCTAEEEEEGGAGDHGIWGRKGEGGDHEMTETKRIDRGGGVRRRMR